jgi:hypothetical protein
MRASVEEKPKTKPRRWLWWVGGGLGVVVLAVVLFLVFFDWNWLRGPVAAEASRVSHRPVRIEGDLKVHLWSWSPTASVDRVWIGNPAWAPAGEFADAGRVTVSIRLLPLLTGRVELRLVEVDRLNLFLMRDAAGRATWRTDPNNTAPLKLPPIQHFVLRDGHVRMVDQQRNLVLSGVVQSRESQAAPGAPAGRFELNGSGTLNREPFSVLITGGPLINVRRDRPYAFDAHAHAGATQVDAHGSLPKPFDFGQVDVMLTLSGQNFGELNDLTELALPDTPPYRLRGRLIRSGQVYRFSQIVGRVGQSDLEGRVSVDRSSGRPNMDADLRSRSLNYQDIGALLGAPPRTGPVTPQQRADAARLQAESRFLPDAPLNLARARKMDAVVRYRADSVIAPANFPLRQVRLTITLDHGVLRFDPVSFSMPHGMLSGRVRVDARPSTPIIDADMKISNIQLEDLFKDSSKAALAGPFQARAVLHGVGDSVHQVASTSDGTVTVVVPRGEIRKAFAELMGINVANGLGLLFAKDQSETAIRCGVADFRAVHGTLHAGTLLIDTDVVTAVGGGNVNLGTEALDLTLQGHPKKFRLFHLHAPVTVTGHLKSPKFGLKPGQVPVQVLGAVALGAVLGPAAAILPFVDPGLNHDADCVALVRGAQQQGAPVKPSQTTTAPSKKH